MPALLIRMYFIGLLLLVTTFGAAQKGIVISESLVANAEKLPVKMGASWPWKVTRFSFGDYAVVSSRVGWVNGSSRSNLFGTKAQSKSTTKFSFVLAGKTGDSAKVNAANNIITREVYPLELFPNVFFGSYKLLKDSSNFSALITINEDTTEIWALFIINAKTDSVDKYEAFLTNRERTIFLEYTRSDLKEKKKRTMSAQGYEFIENEQSLCAVQYVGDGMLGIGKKIVWIRKDLNPKMKLILAAAMTTIMQFIEPGPPDPPL